jgi:rRNA-processing protein FCF1
VNDVAQVLTKPVFVQGKNNSKSETIVLADTNVLLNSGDVQEISAVFAKMGVRIAVTKSILREIKKKDEDLYINAYKNFIVINDKTEEIMKEAIFVHTHAPDNYVIAAAIVKRVPLISRDHVMLKVARAHGVDACVPEELIRQRSHAMGVLQ